MVRWISLINRLFSDINISQGSVARRLRCGGIFNECCIANFLEIITVKECKQEAQLLLGDRATRKHAKDSCNGRGNDNLG